VVACPAPRQLNRSLSSFEMKAIVKFIFLLILFFGITFGISAQSVLYETYSDGGKRAFERGNITESEKLLKTALKEAENLNDLELIADGSVNLGKVYQHQKKYDEAEKLYLRAIEIQEQLDGKDNLSVAYSLNNLGLLYSEQKKYDKSEETLRRALTIREKKLEPTDTNIAVTLVNLGKLYSDQDKLTEAESLYDRAFKIFVLAGDENLEGIFVCIDNLALIYEKTKNYKKAEPLYRFAIAVLEKFNGRNDATLIPYLEDYAALLRKLKRNAEAVKVEARVKRLRQLNR